MGKSLTYEEWKESLGLGDLPLRGAFDKARVGMIPAENAVVIPDVSEWPRHATGINVTYAWDCFDEAIGSPVIAYIPRPKPVWVPRVGDRVFALDTTDGMVHVGVIEEVNGNMSLVTSCGKKGWFHNKELKPFNDSYIPKPWSEIPGGVE